MHAHYGCSKKAIFQTQLNGIMALLYCETARLIFNCALEQTTGLKTFTLTGKRDRVKMSAEYTKRTFTLI